MSYFYVCPNCGSIHDATTCITEESRTPEEGNFSICNGCGDITIFEKDLSQRKATEEEIERVKEEHPYFWSQIQEAVSTIIKRKQLKEWRKHNDSKLY